MLQSNSSEAFDLSKIPQEEETRHVCLTLWVPEHIKEKFDIIQQMSRKKYSKHLKEIVIKDVESVKVED